MGLKLSLRQASFEDFCPITAAVDALASHGTIEERGAVYTRREVVDFILDLVGYSVDRPLQRMRLLEPSFGGGDFLLPAIDRLLIAWKASKQTMNPVDSLGGAIRAVELHRAAFFDTRAVVIALLIVECIDQQLATEIASHWLINGDFLR